MPMISVKDNKNNGWKRNAKTKKTAAATKTEQRGRSYSESVRDKYFFLALKLDFLELICKASLIFKSNLELALSIILNEREFY